MSVDRQKVVIITFSAYRLCFDDGRYLTTHTSHNWAVLFSTALSVCSVSQSLAQTSSSLICHDVN